MKMLAKFLVVLSYIVGIALFITYCINGHTSCLIIGFGLGIFAKLTEIEDKLKQKS